MTRIYTPLVCPAPAGGTTTTATATARRESVQEFIAYFYEFVRDDAGVVCALDRAVKERYGARRD
jgi:hypothetical protein